MFYETLGIPSQHFECICTLGSLFIKSLFYNLEDFVNHIRVLLFLTLFCKLTDYTVNIWRISLCFIQFCYRFLSAFAKVRQGRRIVRRSNYERKLVSGPSRDRWRDGVSIFQLVEILLGKPRYNVYGPEMMLAIFQK